jgi:hypothetical protein
MEVGEMRDKLKPRRPSLGTVLGLTALIVAVVGTAHAAPSKVIVRKGDIAPGAVTAKALANGAVHSKAIAKSAVTARKLAKGAVGTEALAADAVTAGQLAPGSVYGGALGAETIVTKPITDLDAGAHNIEWTASNTEAALCGAGEALLGSGFAFTSPGNGEAAFLQALPIVNGETRGVTGRITTDSGGSASAEIVAICLK